MRITSIKQQLKNKDRYSIFCDGKYCFSLSLAELQEQGLKINQLVDAKKLNELQKIAQADKIYNSVLNLLARRPRSVWEVQNYLHRKGYHNEEIKEILNKLSEKKLLDDYNFAEKWVANRQLLKPTSRRKLTIELRQKNVPNHIIQQVLYEYDDHEEQALQEMIAKKKQMSRYQDTNKLMAYLIRQGFNYGDIKRELQK